MEKVVIDMIIVPAESRAAFLERAGQVQSFLRTIPGYVEGHIYEQQSGESRYNFVTTAVWESQEAIDKAQQIVAEEFQRRGFNRQASAQQLGVESIRGIYDRNPF